MKPMQPSRREFLTTTAVAGSALVASLAPNVHAAGSDVLKIGLIGCGGRGTGAAAQALQADPNVKLTAMGDAFEDRLQKSLATLRKDQKIIAKIDVPQERCFVGFNAYKEVIASGVDVVLLCEPPHFRPAHLKAAIQAGKHVFAEKPVAVDSPGVRSVWESCALAQNKGLSVVSGLCLRYCNAHRAAIGRIQEGAVGDVVAIQSNDLRGRIWMFPREDKWTDMEWQMRNWYYFTWLSGDFNVEQHVHNLDVCSWILKNEYPSKATGMGGRQVRVGTEYGNIFDHHSVVYEYANGVKVFSNCRQQVGCANDISNYVLGTKGTAFVNERAMTSTGAAPWKYSGPKNDFYQTEHDELFASIRSAKPINNGEYMSKSTLLAIMGRMATYTGQVITWDMAMKSKEDLTPARYEWDPIPAPAVPLPGVTKYV